MESKNPNLKIEEPSREDIRDAAWILFELLHVDENQSEKQEPASKRRRKIIAGKVHNATLVKDILKKAISEMTLRSEPETRIAGVMLGILHYKPELIKELIEVLRGRALDNVVNLTAYALKAPGNIKLMRGLEKVLTDNEKTRVLEILTRNNLAFDWNSWKAVSQKYRLDTKNWLPALIAGVNILKHLPQSVTMNLNMEDPVIRNRIEACVNLFPAEVLTLVPVGVWTTSPDLFRRVLNSCPGAIWFLHRADVMNAIKDHAITDMTKVVVDAICYNASVPAPPEKYAQLGVIQFDRPIDYLLEIIQYCAVHDMEYFRACMGIVTKTNKYNACLGGVWPTALYFYALACTCTRQTPPTRDALYYAQNCQHMGTSWRISPTLFASGFDLRDSIFCKPTTFQEISLQIILGCDLGILRPSGYLKSDNGNQVRDICDIVMMLPIFYLSASQGEKKVMNEVFSFYLLHWGSSPDCLQFESSEQLIRVVRTCKLVLVEKLKRAFAIILH